MIPDRSATRVRQGWSLPDWPDQAVLGLHAMKQRWAGAVVREGLVRPSAAWFMVDSATPWDSLTTTLAAAVHLGLGTATCERLAASTGPGEHARLFEAEPLLLPTLLCFADRPTAREETHRYHWLGRPAAGLTVPYTKVEWAGRTCRFESSTGTATPRVVTAELDDVVRIEASVDRWELGAGPGRLIVRSDQHASPGPQVDSKLAWFCVRTAQLLWSRIAGPTL